MKCQCPLAGFCATHGREMNAKQWEQCRSDDRFFDGFQSRTRPSWLKRAGNATKAAGRVVKAVGCRRKVMADAAVTATRKAVCDACPERGPSNVCKECGCALRAKQRLLTESCPLGKWPTALPERP